MYRKFSAIKQLELPRTKRESLTNPFVSVDFNGPEHQACLISQKKVSRIRFYSVFFRYYSEAHYEIDYFENYTAVCSGLRLRCHDLEARVLLTCL